MKNGKTPILPVWIRIILITILYLVLSIILIPIGSIVAKVPLTDMDAIKDITINQALIIQLFALLVSIIAVFTFRKFVDLRTIKSLGFSITKRISDIFLGLIVALLIIGGGSLFLYIKGYIDLSNITVNSSNLLLSFLLFTAVSLSEEILFRGYILNNLLSTMNKYFALIISSVLFALMHSLNFNLSLLALINLFLAGIILGSTYIYTRNLWFPISLHLFWNFFQGPILGYSVSGQKLESLLTLQTLGNETFNGGEFGFEGSIVCTVLSIMTIFLLLFWYKKKTLISLAPE